MKRLLVVLVLAMVATAVAAAPAYAYLDAQGAAYTATTAPTVTVPHAGILGVATTQGKAAQVALFRGGGMHVGMVPASHGGTGVGIAAILVLVIGLASCAILADRRQPVSAASGNESVQFLGHKPTAEQGRKAA
jgi:hypothetical protein